MKQRTNQFYQSMPRELKEHLLNNLMLSDLDTEILKSIMTHDAESAFHSQNVGISDRKFDRHLLGINDNVMREITRLAIVGIHAERTR